MRGPDFVILLGMLMLAAGTAGLVLNAALWVRAARRGRLAAHHQQRRRPVVLAYFAAVLVGTTLIWSTLP